MQSLKLKFEIFSDVEAECYHACTWKYTDTDINMMGVNIIVEYIRNETSKK